MAALALDEATERVAVNLLRHLEWQAEGFSLVFVFADVGPSIQLAEWLDERLALQGRPLARQEASATFVEQPEAAVDALIARLADISAQPGAWWYAVQRHPSDTRWNSARSVFLARLNERRFLLERDLARPLVLVLPADFRAEARNIAPDIWHVRALSEELRASATGAALEGSLRVASTVTADLDTPTPAFDEWRRMLQAQSAPDRLFLPTAWRASSELVAARRLADADAVARAAVALSRSRAAKDDSASALRDLSISLDTLGGVASAQGDWAQAEAAYRESLALRRQLVDRLGGAPEALRELAVALDNLGDVARARGDWSQAEAAYRESLALRRELADRLGGTPEALRDLSVSLDKVGVVASAQGDWSQADAVYRESVALSRQLVERLGGTPGALRDLSVALDNAGRAASAQGDWSRAEAAYRESLALRRQLAERLGGTPEALRDLSVALDNAGAVASAQGDLPQAEAAYRESLALSRQLVERLGGTPDSLDDLAVSLLNVAELVPGDAGLRAEAMGIYESLAASHPEVARYGEALARLRGDNAPASPASDPTTPT